MLRGKRIMVLLSTTLLFTGSSPLTPSHSLATEVVKDLNFKLPTNEYGMVKQPIEEQLQKNKEMYLKKKQQEELELKRKQEELKKKSEPQWQEFILTFYTSSDSENGFGPITCEGKPLVAGGVANNVIPLHTDIYLQGYGNVFVNDRGSNKYFSTSNRLDVYVPRRQGESDSHYIKRVTKLGVQKVKGYIIK